MNRPLEELAAELGAHPLFRGMSEEEICRFLLSAGAAVCRFAKGDQLRRSTDGVRRMGLLLTGRASLVRDDREGNRCVLSGLQPWDLFGLSSAIAGDLPEGLSVVASTGCTALMMDVPPIPDPEAGAGQILFRNILTILAERNTELLRKQYFMAQKTLRKKISAYLSEEADAVGKRTFTVGMNRQELADFLGSDRSALCAELSRMQKDGLIAYHGHDFCLLPAFSEADDE